MLIPPRTLLPPHWIRFLRSVEDVERRVGVPVFWTVANLLTFSVLFFLYGDFDLYAHGEVYFRRSEDFFLQDEETRRLFTREVGLENVLLPFIGYVLRAVLKFFDQEYVRRQFLFISLLPYFFFMVGTCLHFRKGLGFVGTAALAVALYSSGLVPHMLLWSGYVDGASFLILLLVYVLIDRSLPLTLLLVMAAALNHYLAVVPIMLLAVSAWIVRPERRYATVLVACIATLVVSQVYWTLEFGAASMNRANETVPKFSSLRALMNQLAEAYAIVPWNFLSAFKLETIPLVYTGFVLMRRSRAAGAAYAIPMLFGMAFLLVTEDLTRFLTLMAMPSFLFMLSLLAGSSQPMLAGRMGALMDSATRAQVLSLFAVCAFFSLFTPNYVVNNGDIVAPEPVRIEKALRWVGEIPCRYAHRCD